MFNFKKVTIIAISSLFLLSNVKGTTCNYEEKATLNNEISNVKTNYEIKERVLDKSEYEIPDALLGTEYEDTYVATEDYIVLNILNLTENMYVEVSNDLDDEVKIYQYSDTNNGNIAIERYNLIHIVNYTVKVYASSATGCEGNLLRTLSQKLPRDNEYSSYSICSVIPEYYLCQRYVTFDDVGFDTFINKTSKEIEKQEEKEKQEKDNDKWYEKAIDFVKEHKVPFIIGGVGVIVIAGGTTFVIIKKRRRSVI